MNVHCFLTDAVCHIGRLSPEGQLSKRSVKKWDFEFGLLSVSLLPEAWRNGWAGEEAVIYQITAAGRQLCFLDADDALARHGAIIEDVAIERDLLRRGAEGIEATERLYAGLELEADTRLQLTRRTFEDQLRQAALAVLASNHISIDGLWWPDLLEGEMLTARGGVYQHHLGKLDVEIVPAASDCAKLVETLPFDLSVVWSGY